MWSRFLHDRRAASAFIVALALPILLGILLLAIDATSVQSAYSKNQGAVDSTALVVADHIVAYRVKKGTKIRQEGLRDFALGQYALNTANDQSYFTPKEETFEVEVTTNRVKVSSCVESENSFTAALGIRAATSTACNEAEASIPDIGHVEIALALDVTSSMLENIDVRGRRMTKIDALKQALVGDGSGNGLLNKDLITEAAVEGGIYWSVVPFRGMVDLGANAKNIVGNDWDNNAVRKSQSEYEYDDREFANITRMRTDRSDVGWDLYKRAAGGDRTAYGRFLSGGFWGKYKHVYTDVDDPEGVKRYYHDNAENLLGRVALTERMSGNNSLADDYSPVGNDKFKAYWHHPRKYWMHFPAGGNSIAHGGRDRSYCGSCVRALGNWGNWVGGGCPSAETITCPVERDPGGDGDGDGDGNGGDGNNNGTGTDGGTGGTPVPSVPGLPSMDNK